MTYFCLQSADIIVRISFVKKIAFQSIIEDWQVKTFFENKLGETACEKNDVLFLKYGINIKTKFESNINYELENTRNHFITK